MEAYMNIVNIWNHCDAEFEFKIKMKWCIYEIEKIFKKYLSACFCIYSKATINEFWVINI